MLFGKAFALDPFAVRRSAAVHDNASTRWDGCWPLESSLCLCPRRFSHLQPGVVASNVAKGRNVLRELP
jgi:hypothetical protein